MKDKAEPITHFDKFIVKAVSSLLVIGIIASIGTNLSMAVSIGKVETELKYINTKLEESTRDRYTNSMAITDKSISNDRFKYVVSEITGIKKKQSKIWQRINAVEKDIIKMGK